MGGITEIASGSPGYSSVLPNTCAPLARTLKLNGLTFEISYSGGGGDDVVLTQVPPTTIKAVLSGGVLALGPKAVAEHVDAPGSGDEPSVSGPQDG